MTETHQENPMLVRIKKMYPTEQNKVSAIATLLSTSAVLTQFVMSQHDPSTLPDVVGCSCATTAGNMIAWISDEEEIEVHHMSMDGECVMDEQTEEAVYRKMKLVIQMMYQAIQEREKV